MTGDSEVRVAWLCPTSHPRPLNLPCRCLCGHRCSSSDARFSDTTKLAKWYRRATTAPSTF
jgi:hypothetical protein